MRLGIVVQPRDRRVGVFGGPALRKGGANRCAAQHLTYRSAGAQTSLAAIASPISVVLRLVVARSVRSAFTARVIRAASASRPR